MPDSPSRRGFLRGGLGAFGAALVIPRARADEPVPAEAPVATATAPAPDPGGFADGSVVSCTVNGEARTIEADADAMALDAVRERLGLTGAKRACGHGACGACTMLVDGVPRVTCVMPVSALEGKQVRTIEAIGVAAGGLHAVQRAFVAEDALQCGYCTPGFVVEAAAFHDRWRAANGATRPSRAEVADALEGHLCRCGAHPRILDAVARACAGEFDAGEAAGPRYDAVQKVTGAARYTADVRLDGQLEGAMLRSPAGNAVLARLDLDALRKAPGVRAVVPYLPIGGRAYYAGQDVVAVAADTAEQARAAVEGAVVEWREEPPVLGLDAARAEGSPAVFPTNKAQQAGGGSSAEGATLPGKLDGNVRGPVQLPFARPGAVPKRIEAARAEGGTVVEGRYTTQTQCHTTLEPHCCVARWGADGGLEVWASTQSLSDLAADIAEHYELRREQVRVRAEFVGGGFGSKAGMQMEHRVACDLAKAANAPVRFAYDRANEIAVAGLRPGVDMQMTLAADAAGEIAGLQGTAWADGGVSVGAATISFARLIYDTPFKDLKDYDVLTHAPPVKAFRAPGGPAACFALEQSVDALAWARGEDPVALRRRWTPLPARQRLYDWVETVPAWKERARTAGVGTGRIRTGLGFAMGFWMPMVQTGVNVVIEASRDGIVAAAGCQDMGNGSKTVVARSVAAALGIPPKRVRVRFGDSDDPYAPMSAGSRSTVSMAPTATLAAEALQRALVATAEDHLGLSEAEWAPGGVKHAGGFVGIDDLLAASPPITVSARRPRDPGGYYLPFSMGGLRFPGQLPASLQLSEVEVDTHTGVVRVTRSWTGIAVGHIHVPEIARTQVEGAVVQGVSYALYEDRRLDPHTGRAVTRDLETYRIAGLGDVPEMDVHFDDTPFDGILGGGVGLSEIATVPVAASIANAVYHATGRRPRKLPLRPDLLLSEVLS